MADGERTGKPKAEHFTNYPSPISGKNTTNVFGTPAKDIFIIHELMYESINQVFLELLTCR